MYGLSSGGKMLAPGAVQGYGWCGAGLLRGVIRGMVVTVIRWAADGDSDWVGASGVFEPGHGRRRLPHPPPCIYPTPLEPSTG